MHRSSTSWPVKLSCLVAFVPLLLLGSSCSSTRSWSAPQSGSRYGPQAGESEITVGAALSSTSTSISGTDLGGSDDRSFENQNFSGQLGLGYFVNEKLEVGAQVVSTVSGDDDIDSGSFGFLPYVRYNLRVADRSVIYFGAHAGAQIIYYETIEVVDLGGGNSAEVESGESDTTFSGGVHVGFKTWITPATSLFIEPRFTSYTSEFDEIEIDTDETLVILGLSFTF